MHSLPLQRTQARALSSFKPPDLTMTSSTTLVEETAVQSRTEGKILPQAQRPSALKDDKFFWSDQEEPHRTRRIQIIKAHPEVTKLCGIEPLTKYLVLLVCGIQILCAFLLRNQPILSLPFLATTYIVGATANQNLFLAIHEISHNLAFKSPLWNRLLAIYANLPIGVPYSAAFRVRHPQLRAEMLELTSK